MNFEKQLNEIMCKECTDDRRADYKYEMERRITLQFSRVQLMCLSEIFYESVKSLVLFIRYGSYILIKYISEGLFLYRAFAFLLEWKNINLKIFKI